MSRLATIVVSLLNTVLVVRLLCLQASGAKCFTKSSGYFHYATFWGDPAYTMTTLSETACAHLLWLATVPAFNILLMFLMDKKHNISCKSGLKVLVKVLFSFWTKFFLLLPVWCYARANSVLNSALASDMRLTLISSHFWANAFSPTGNTSFCLKEGWHLGTACKRRTPTRTKMLGVSQVKDPSLVGQYLGNQDLQRLDKTASWHSKKT